MNVALPALVIFVLLLPGFALRTRYKRVERTSLDYSPFGQVVTEGIAWAAFLHAVWLAGAYLLFDQRLRTDVLIGLLGSDSASQGAAMRYLRATDTWIAVYFGTLYVAALTAGGMARAAITRFRLDQRDSKLAFWFRFSQAPWYYLLTAADLPDSEKPDLILASAIVQAGKDAYLYSGVVEYYYVSEEGQLDRLVLSGAGRRRLDADKASADQPRDERFYPIDGDFLVLRYEEVVTLNIQYVRLEEVPDAGATESDQATVVDDKSTTSYGG